MTPRERFHAAVKYKNPDRAVFDLYGCPQTTVISAQKTEDIKKLLGISGNYTGNLFYDERILKRFNIDTRMTGGFPSPKSPLSRVENNVIYSEWGIGYSPVGDHHEATYFPLKDKTLDEIKDFPFPEAGSIDNSLYEIYAAHAKDLYENTDYAVIAQHPVFGVFEIGCWMFGFDDFLYRFAAEPETVEWFFEKIFEYQKGVIIPYYTALGKYIDCTTSGDDFGTQASLFVSVPMFDEMIAPFFSERIKITKSLTKACFQHHTCGAVFPLVPSLVSCGVDIINPIQPKAYNMEPERLRDKYQGKIAFWGGVDTQELLTNGTPDDVKREVRRILEIFGTSGGYILAPAHCIQDDVPAQNVVALYEGANEYYK